MPTNVGGFGPSSLWRCRKVGPFENTWRACPDVLGLGSGWTGGVGCGKVQSGRSETESTSRSSDGVPGSDEVAQFFGASIRPFGFSTVLPTPSIATAISQPLGDGEDPLTQLTLNRGEEGGLVPLGGVSAAWWGTSSECWTVPNGVDIEEPPTVRVWVRCCVCYERAPTSLPAPVAQLLNRGGGQIKVDQTCGAWGNFGGKC